MVVDLVYTAEVYLLENDDVLAVRVPKECGARVVGHVRD